MGGGRGWKEEEAIARGAVAGRAGAKGGGWPLSLAQCSRPVTVFAEQAQPAGHKQLLLLRDGHFRCRGCCCDEGGGSCWAAAGGLCDAATGHCSACRDNGSALRALLMSTTAACCAPQQAFGAGLGACWSLRVVSAINTCRGEASLLGRNSIPTSISLGVCSLKAGPGGA